jgi:drug/metabolite transporter (DMT)-like permease
VTTSPAASRVPSSHVDASSLIPVAVLTLVWGCNWPVLKLGVTEIAPLTFRSLTLPFAALGLLLVARLAGDSIRIPRRLWGKVALLALFNIAGWNGLVLFGLQQLPAGRSAILAFTMPVWSVLFSLMLLSEPLSRRRILGVLLGMVAMGVLLGDDILTGSADGGSWPGAAIGWALGTVLLRKWKVPIAQNTLSG